ncbi:EFR1 family ferrodoxin [Clostridium chromiireducens]|uniref:EFR1 family ferrodoxin n=1 Tax=Clostridium chromiireducens TaxID=225345 RepID=UPI003AF423F1
MKVFYFTTTGNSLYVAKRIGGELYSIPHMIKEGKHEFEDDVIGFIFPCYVFGLPKLVKDFVKKTKFKANYFFAVMTYGHKAESGLYHMEKVGGEAGIKFSYTNEILMVDNYLPAFKIEDELKKEGSKKIEEKLNKIINDISTRQNKYIRKSIKSVILSKSFSSLAGRFSYNFGRNNFIVLDNCTSCKVCEKVCPVNNISISKKPEFSNKCEMCHACIHHCPQNAIHLKNEKSKVRFINRNVKLKEIIDANNQK